MHLSVSLNELLKLTGFAPALEVSGGGSEGGSDSTSEFTSEFLDEPFLPLVEGEEKQITRTDTSVASEIPARDLMADTPKQVANDWLPMGHHADRLFGTEIPQSLVTTSSKKMPVPEIGWLSKGPAHSLRNQRVVAAVTVEHGNDATGPKIREAALLSTAPEKVRSTTPVIDVIGSESSEKDSLPHIPKRVSVQDSLKSELTVVAQSGRSAAMGNVAPRTNTPPVMNARSANHDVPKRTNPKLSAPLMAAAVSDESPERGARSEVLLPHLDKSASSRGAPEASRNAVAVSKDTLKTTPSAEGIRVFKRAASSLEHIARPRDEHTPVDQTVRRVDAQIRQEPGNAPNVSAVSQQKLPTAVEQATEIHRNHTMTSRFFPTVQVEVVGSPAEMTSKQLPPNPVKLSPGATTATPAPQVEVRSQEAFPTPHTAAQTVIFEDGGAFPISIVGAESAPRGQLPTPSPIRPQAMPQHSVPADELSLMLRGLALQRTGSEVTTTELILEPMELGRIRVTLSGGESSGQITILVERGETLDLVKRHLDLVRADLRASGWEATDLSLSRESFSSFDGTDPGEAAQPDESDETQPDPKEAVELARSDLAGDQTSGGGLDLRV